MTKNDKEMAFEKKLTKNTTLYPDNRQCQPTKLPLLLKPCYRHCDDTNSVIGSVSVSLSVSIFVIEESQRIPCFSSSKVSPHHLYSPYLVLVVVTSPSRDEWTLRQSLAKKADVKVDLNGHHLMERRIWMHRKELVQPKLVWLDPALVFVKPS